MGKLKLYVKHSDTDFAGILAKSFCLCDGVDVYIGEPKEQDLMEFIVMSFDPCDRTNYRRYVQLSFRETDENLSADNCVMYLFSSAALIIEKMKAIFGYEVARNKVEQERCKTMSFVSERSCCGTSSCALATSYIMGTRFGFKTIYLNLCHTNYRIFELLRGDLGELNMASGFDESSAVKLMYALKQRQDLDIEAYIEQSHGISYFKMALLNRRLDDFDISLIDELRIRLYERGYEYLIIDIGTNLSRQAIEIAEDSDNTLYK